MDQIDLFLLFESFIIDVLMEQDPEVQLNTELLEAIRSDCELISEKREELELTGFAVDASEDHQDGVLEFFAEQFILTPDSLWLPVMEHASRIGFRAEGEELVMTLTYENLFAA